uniref:Archaeal ATPase n=1 Tax=Agathobacter sp. TaxID=2021311 RepID=UPI004055F5B4
MEYLDFSSVITTIRKYISDAHSMNQIDMMYQLFVSFLSSDESLDFDFDNGLVCRWFNGQAKISPRITRYYLDNYNRNRLAADMHRNVLPIMYDSAMAVQEVYNILVQDTTISNKTKERLLQNYPCETKMDEAIFLTSALCFGMERTFVKRDANTKNLLSTGNLSPVVKDFIYDGGTPKPCRHFCGRNNELATLHQLLCSHGKVFLQGIAGIGKSELAKAYAKIHSKEYTNILYLCYTGDLKQDISDIDFADDLPDDGNEERFRKHNRFLRTLKEDTLFIIDNFNTTATKDSILNVILKYRCRILFTTRSRFDNYTSMNLEEIADTEALIKLMGYFYSDAEKNRPILEQIIQTVHSHTLAVEMSARLLESGIMEPMHLLKKLKEEKAALDATDTIGISKDGKSRKATYYDHIHTLFSLYQLSEDETDIMRNLALTPLSGVQNRLFASWLKLRDMNTVNDLIEKGFVKAMEGRIIALHPMIQEVTVEETKPSVQNCRTLLYSLQQICLRHGEEVPYYKQLFQTIESVTEQIENDNMPIYLRFLEDVFPYMENYHYYQGMELVIDTLSTLLKDAAIGSVSDRALLLSYQAAYEKKPDKAIKMQKDAIAMISEVTPDNALLISNLYANLGGMYRVNGKLELAKKNMEQAIKIIDEYSLAQYHDSVVQITNYAVLLTDMGQPEVGLSALRKLCRVIREYNSDTGLDYASVQEAMGNISLAMGEIQQAKVHFMKMLTIYETVFEFEPDVIETKKQELLGTYIQAGLYIGNNLLGNK